MRRNGQRYSAEDTDAEVQARTLAKLVAYWCTPDDTEDRCRNEPRRRIRFRHRGSR